ncbi:MAG TPA: FHA domain-containing protein, partial [Polyangiaceae bacterium]|nr:FHA domain-containing protein [Polyangiaceae bacterium]
MWVLTIEDEQGARTQVNLVRDVYSVGRDPTCTICLLDRNVSRLHAELRALPSGGWEIVDQSSRYGSSVNGLRVRARAALASGDAVQIGGYSFSLLDEAAVLDGGPAPAPGKPDRLLVLEGAGAGRELRLDRGPVTIGGGTGCHLTLSDPALRFVVRPLEGRRYELVNVGPRAEVSINLGPVWRKLLEDEDLIEVPGEIVLRFLRGDRAGSAEAGARSSAPPPASGGERPTWPAASPHLPGSERPTWPTASTRLPGGEWPAAAAAISPSGDRPSLPPSLRP